MYFADGRPSPCLAAFILFSSPQQLTMPKHKCCCALAWSPTGSRETHP